MEITRLRTPILCLQLVIVETKQMIMEPPLLLLKGKWHLWLSLRRDAFLLVCKHSTFCWQVVDGIYFFVGNHHLIALCGDLFALELPKLRVHALAQKLLSKLMSIVLIIVCTGQLKGSARYTIRFMRIRGIISCPSLETRLGLYWRILPPASAKYPNSRATTHWRLVGWWNHGLQLQKIDLSHISAIIYRNKARVNYLHRQYTSCVLAVSHMF